MIKNIVFDLGNVLLRFNHKEYLKIKMLKDETERIHKAIFLSEE